MVAVMHCMDGVYHAIGEFYVYPHSLVGPPAFK